jgi:hypothetical protein
MSESGELSIKCDTARKLTNACEGAKWKHLAAAKPRERGCFLPRNRWPVVSASTVFSIFASGELLPFGNHPSEQGEIAG